MSLHRSVILAPALAALAGLAPAAFAQPTTAFTYQGQLRSAGLPAEGPHDLEFRLFTALNGGTQVGPTLCSDDLPVTGGVFTVALEFGDQYSVGDALFLQISARQDLDDACVDGDPFTTLTPRQPLTVVPFAWYSLQARNASNAQSADNANSLGGQPSTFYRNASNLNAGTLPSARFSGTYSNAVTFSGALTVSNPLSAFAGSGAGLVGLNAANISQGLLADARLGPNIARLDGTNAWTGANTLANPANVFGGDGSALTNLNAGNITTGQLGGAQLADNAVDTFKIAPGAIINSDISDNSISTTKLVNGAVTSFKLAAGSVSGGVGGTITDGSIGNSDLQASSITSSNLVDFTIAANDIAPAAISGGVTGPIADESINAFDLAIDSVGASEIAAGAVGNAELASNSVTTTKLAVDAVSNTRLALDAASLARVSGGALQSDGTHVGLGGAPSATHEFYINGRAYTETGMTTPGSITAAEFAFQTPFPRVYSVGPYDMVREDGGVAFGETNGNAHDGQPFLYNTSLLVTVSCGAPVHLPDGAIVTMMEARAIDSSAFDMTVQLLRRGFDGASGGTMAQVVTSGDVVDTVRSFSDTTISAPTIDNLNFQYYVRLEFPPGNQPINFKGVIIRYTVPRPLP